MPELPEVETALRGVSPYLKNYVIEKIEVRRTSAETPLGSLAGISSIASSKNSRAESPRQIPHYSY